MGKVSIYALTDVVTDEVYYVGQTSNPKRRRAQHYYGGTGGRGPWIGHRHWPKMTILEIVSEGVSSSVKLSGLKTCGRPSGMRVPKLAKARFSNRSRYFSGIDIEHLLPGMRSASLNYIRHKGGVPAAHAAASGLLAR